MKTLRLPLNQMQTHTDVVDLLEREALKPGDKLDVVITKQEKSIWLFAILLLLAGGLFAYFYKGQGQEERIVEGGRILEDLFASENAEALEREIEAEYGIQIEFVQSTEDPEREDWLQRSKAALASAYGDDEPDYSTAVVLEPNPDFNPS
jgi:hypothetical protein